MIRQTLRGMQEIWRVVWPIAALAVPAIAGAILLYSFYWLGIGVMVVWAVGLVLVTAYYAGEGC